MSKNEEFKKEIQELGIPKTSPIRAIKMFYYECCGESYYEVKYGNSKKCALYPFRFGFNPFSNRTMSNERKQAASERLKNFHKNRKENNNEED